MTNQKEQELEREIILKEIIVTYLNNHYSNDETYEGIKPKIYNDFFNISAKEREIIKEIFRLTFDKAELKGLKEGKAQALAEVMKIIKKYKYNQKGSFDVKTKDSYTRVSFKAFLGELKAKLQEDLK